MGKAIFDDETAVLQAGSNDNGTEMLYSLWKVSSEGPHQERWRQPIPDRLSRDAGEYYALIKGLRMAIDRGHSMAIVSTNSPPVVDQLQDGEQPSVELKPLYEMACKLIRQFEEVEIHPYAMDLRR